MKTLGIRALKQNASAVVAQAAAGDAVTITDRGRAMAQLVPLPTGQLASLIAGGAARERKRSLADLTDAPTRSRSEKRLGETLEAMREEERF